MEIKQLESFVAVVEWGSFSQAARHLYVTQPTVSTQIKQLETELDAQLLLRTTQKLELTPIGREFYNNAKSILRIIQNIEDTFENKSLQTLNIGASSVPSANILPKVLTEFRQCNADTHLNVHEADSIEIIDLVANGQIHAAIVGTTMPNKELEFKKIFADRLVIVTPNTAYYQAFKTAGENPLKLLKEPIILREKGSGTLEESLKMLKSVGITKQQLNNVATINDSETLKNFVKEGLGVTIMSEISMTHCCERDDLLYFYIKEYDDCRDFYLVYRKSATLSEPLNNLITFLANYDYDTLTK